MTNFSHYVYNGQFVIRYKGEVVARVNPITSTRGEYTFLTYDKNIQPGIKYYISREFGITNCSRKYKQRFNETFNNVITQLL